MERMEVEFRNRAGVGAGAGRTMAAISVELPSFVDDMCADIVVWDGYNNNM